MNESFSLMKNVLVELRKENEELRKDRRFLLDRLKTILIELEKHKMPTVIKNQKEEKQQQEEKQQKEEPKQQEPEEEVPLQQQVQEEKEGKTKTSHIDRRIETPLDELLELVIDKGSIKLADAAKKFKVKERQIEEWARILEEHELIEVHYPTIGKPVLKRRH